MFITQARNPRYKPKKERLYGPEYQTFLAYCHQLAKLNDKNLKSIELAVQDVKGDNNGFYDCADLLLEQRFNHDFKTESLVELMRFGMESGKIHATSEDPFKFQGSLKCLYKRQLTTVVLHKPVLQIYKKGCCMEHLFVHVLSADHIILHQIIRPHHPLPFADQVQVETLTECRRGPPPAAEGEHRQGVLLTIKCRLVFVDLPQDKKLGASITKLPKAMRTEIEAAFTSATSGTDTESMEKYVSEGLDKWFKEYDVQKQENEVEPVPQQKENQILEGAAKSEAPPTLSAAEIDGLQNRLADVLKAELSKHEAVLRQQSANEAQQLEAQLKAAIATAVADTLQAPGRSSFVKL